MGVEYSTEVVEGIAFTDDEIREVQLREGVSEDELDLDYWLAGALEDADLSYYFFGNQWDGSNIGMAVGVEKRLDRDLEVWSDHSEYGPSEIPKGSSLTESQYDDLVSLSIRILGHIRPVRTLLLQSVF